MEIKPDTIHVSANHREEVQATHADLFVTVRGSSVISGNEAMKKAKEVSALVDELTHAGVPAEDIHLQGVHVESSSGILLKSSNATYRLRIRCGKLEQLPELLDIVSAQKNAAAVDLPITFRCSSIYQLEFENSFFDRCRADKTFQHLSDPRAALKEMIRVTKPGGKIIIADPDHDSLIIDTPFTDVNQRFTRFRSAHMPQGGIAHQMYGICKELGLVNVYVDALTHVYTDYEEKKVTSPYLEEIWVAEQHGVVSHEEAEKWAAYVLEAIESERFMCMQTYVITMAMKPLHESNTA